MVETADAWAGFTALASNGLSCAGMSVSSTAVNVDEPTTLCSVSGE